VAGSCEYGDEPSGSGATELVSFKISMSLVQITASHHQRTNRASQSGNL
jgi:hypothetical protein